MSDQPNFLLDKAAQVLDEKAVVDMFSADFPEAFLQSHVASYKQLRGRWDREYF